MIESIAQYNFIASKIMNSEVIERSKRLEECANFIKIYAIKYDDDIAKQWEADILSIIIP